MLTIRLKRHPFLTVSAFNELSFGIICDAWAFRCFKPKRRTAVPVLLQSEAIQRFSTERALNIFDAANFHEHH